MNDRVTSHQDEVIELLPRRYEQFNALFAEVRMASDDQRRPGGGR